MLDEVNCGVDGGPLFFRDAPLAARLASEGAPSLGSRTHGLVVVDVASRAPPPPAPPPAEATRAVPALLVFFRTQVHC